MWRTLRDMRAVRVGAASTITYTRSAQHVLLAADELLWSHQAETMALARALGRFGCEPVRLADPLFGRIQRLRVNRLAVFQAVENRALQIAFTLKQEGLSGPAVLNRVPVERVSYLRSALEELSWRRVSLAERVDDRAQRFRYIQDGLPCVLTDCHVLLVLRAVLLV